MSSPNGILSKSKSNCGGGGGGEGQKAQGDSGTNGMKFNKGECTQHTEKEKQAVQKQTSNAQEGRGSPQAALQT